MTQIFHLVHTAEVATFQRPHRCLLCCDRPFISHELLLASLALAHANFLISPTCFPGVQVTDFCLTWIPNRLSQGLTLGVCILNQCTHYLEHVGPCVFSASTRQKRQEAEEGCRRAEWWRLHTSRDAMSLAWSLFEHCQLVSVGHVKLVSEYQQYMVFRDRHCHPHF